MATADQVTPDHIAAKQPRCTSTKGMADGYMMSACWPPVTESISAILLRRFLGLLRRFAAGLARQAERPKAFGVGEDGALPGLVLLHRQRRVARAVFLHRGLGRLIGACLGGPCGLVRGRASMKRRLAPPHDH